MKLKNKELSTYLYFASLYVFISSFLIISAFLIYNRIQDYHYTFIQFYERFTGMWDVNHYITIARNGYTAVGEDNVLLVFFPFYPLCIRLVHMVTTLDYKYCASLISIISSFFSMVMFYKLMLLDYSRKKAFNCVRFYIFFPFSFFLFTKMSEGLFMLLLFSCIYLLRKKKYIAAGLVGYMLTLTRLPGLAVGVIMLVEIIINALKDIKKKDFKIHSYIMPLIMMMLTLLGFLTYLFINYRLHKNPFEFLNFQNDHWSQHAENPVYVLKVIFNNQFKNHGLPFSYGVGLTNLISMILVFLAGIYACCNFRPSYGIYTLVYFYVCYSASWLLSGARYSIGAFPIFMAIGTLTAKYKKTSIAVSIILLILTIPLIVLYVNGNMY